MWDSGPLLPQSMAVVGISAILNVGLEMQYEMVTFIDKGGNGGRRPLRNEESYCAKERRPLLLEAATNKPLGLEHSHSTGDCHGERRIPPLEVVWER